MIVSTNSKPICGLSTGPLITRRMRAEHAVPWPMCFLCGVTGVISLGLLMMLLDGENLVEGTRAGTLAVRLTAAIFLPACFLTAYLTRGGVSFIEAGIAIVRADGCRASRLRCVWRALLSWAFMGVLGGITVFALALATEAKRPWLGLGMFFFAVSLFVGYLALMIWKPARAPHDFVAGTYLVPR